MFEEKEETPSFLSVIFIIIAFLCFIFIVILFYKILNDDSLLGDISALLN